MLNTDELSIHDRMLLRAVSKGYLVLHDGTVIGPRRRPLNLAINPSGYRMIGIRYPASEGRRVGTVRACRLQAYQKFGERIFNSNLEVRHLDGNPANDAHSNIGLGTGAENSMDKPPEVRRRSALKAALAQRRFTDTDIIAMRRERNAGVKLKILCAKYGIKKGHMSAIVNNKLYTHTSAEIIAL